MIFLLGGHDLEMAEIRRIAQNNGIGCLDYVVQKITEENEMLTYPNSKGLSVRHIMHRYFAISNNFNSIITFCTHNKI